MRRHSGKESHFEADVRCHRAVGERPGGNPWCGQNSLGKNSWKCLSLIGDETVINLQSTKVYVFSDSVLCLGKVHQHPESNEAWKKRIEWIITEKSYRDYDGINGEPTELEWNIFPGFTTLQLCGKVTDLLSRLGEEPETFTGRILFMSMFKKNVWRIPKSSPYLQRILVLDSGHLLVQVPKRSGIPWKRIAHKELVITSRTRCCGIRRKRMSYFPCNDSIVQV